MFKIQNLYANEMSSRSLYTKDSHTLSRFVIRLLDAARVIEVSEHFQGNLIEICLMIFDGSFINDTLQRVNETL